MQRRPQTPRDGKWTRGFSFGFSLLLPSRAFARTDAIKAITVVDGGSRIAAHEARPCGSSGSPRRPVENGHCQLVACIAVRRQGHVVEVLWHLLLQVLAEMEVHRRDV